MITSQLLLHIVFSFLPFLVCLFWFICFVVHTRRDDEPKLYFTVYIATCVVLYLCHALFFTIGLTYEMECLWTLCSLSVYPMFYGYLCRLTSSGFNVCKMIPWLVPGIVVALAKYVFPDAGVDKIRMLLFVCQIIGVCYLGINKLKAFDREIQSVYADVEGRDTTAVHHLLVAIIVVSMFSGVANSIGKDFFGESLWLLIPISSAFSSLLFSLSYICFVRDFTIDNLQSDERVAEELTQEHVEERDIAQIGRKIDELLTVQHYFTKKDLKIGDIATEIASNRTYVSNYINRTYHCSFSELVNKLRIEYAMTLLTSATEDTKLTQIAERAGFASEQSFYRNFKKIVGTTPKDWLDKIQRGESKEPQQK